MEEIYPGILRLHSTAMGVRPGRLGPAAETIHLRRIAGLGVWSDIMEHGLR